MLSQINNFFSYLKNERNYSPHTAENYKNDLIQLQNFLNDNNILAFTFVDKYLCRKFLAYLESRKLSRRSVARKISCCRSFYKFLMREKIVSVNPWKIISIPKIQKKLPSFLYNEEMGSLLDQPDIKTPLGLRDKAILEFLYATGVRVSELTKQ